MYSTRFSSSFAGFSFIEGAAGFLAPGQPPPINISIMSSPGVSLPRLGEGLPGFTGPGHGRNPPMILSGSTSPFFTYILKRAAELSLRPGMPEACLGRPNPG